MNDLKNFARVCEKEEYYITFFLIADAAKVSYSVCTRQGFSS
jgi:hypothetical protein